MKERGLFKEMAVFGNEAYSGNKKTSVYRNEGGVTGMKEGREFCGK